MQCQWGNKCRICSKPTDATCNVVYTITCNCKLINATTCKVVNITSWNCKLTNATTCKVVIYFFL